AEQHEVREILERYGLSRELTQPIIDAFQKDHKAWADWMMRFELGLEAPDPRRAVNSAVTIALSYIAGGFVPLTPYFLAPSPQTALVFSAVATILALFGFGYLKGRFTGTRALASAVRTTVTGSLAAAAAYGIASAIA